MSEEQQLEAYKARVDLAVKNSKDVNELVDSLEKLVNKIKESIAGSSKQAPIQDDNYQSKVDLEQLMKKIDASSLQMKSLAKILLRWAVTDYDDITARVAKTRPDIKNKTVRETVLAVCVYQYAIGAVNSIPSGRADSLLGSSPDPPKYKRAGEILDFIHDNKVLFANTPLMALPKSKVLELSLFDRIDNIKKAIRGMGIYDPTAEDVCLDHTYCRGVYFGHYHKLNQVVDLYALDENTGERAPISLYIHPHQKLIYEENRGTLYKTKKDITEAKTKRFMERNSTPTNCKYRRTEE